MGAGTMHSAARARTKQNKISAAKSETRRKGGAKGEQRESKGRAKGKQSEDTRHTDTYTQTQAHRQQTHRYTHDDSHFGQRTQLLV